MKPTENLKGQSVKAQTEEEAMDTIKEAGMLLDDEELETVSGGKAKGEEYHGMPMGEYGLVITVLHPWVCSVEVESTGAIVQALFGDDTIAPGRRVRIVPEGSNTWRIVEILN